MEAISMSHSVPSESSAIDATFLVGIDLVEFDRRDLPIYLKPQTAWADACFDDAPYGAPLDRIFGEPGDIHVDSAAVADDPLQAGAAMAGDDPLVLMSGLADGLSPSTIELPATADVTTVFGFDGDVPTVVHLDDGAGWNAADGTFDFVA
jgi:hypothetical protein